MLRSFLLFLAIAPAACSFEPFDPGGLPKGVWIQDSFTEMEEEAIAEKIREVNAEMGEGLLGYPILVYMGRYRDENGFDFDDLGDGKHVVYRLEDGDIQKWLEEQNDKGLGGYATLADVLMFINLDGVVEAEEKIAEIEATIGWETSEELVDLRNQYIEARNGTHKRFRRVLLHEFGHHIGIAHHSDPCGLMFFDSKNTERFEPVDKAAFCLGHDCLYEPFVPECTLE